MRFSSLFQKSDPRPNSSLVQFAQGDAAPQVQFTPVCSSKLALETRVTSTKLDQTRVNQSTFAIPVRTWCLPTQAAWLNDTGRLRIWEKSRQVGATKTDALDSVLKASPAGARFDVWVTSRDDIQARLYLEDCVEWARILHVAAENLGVLVLEPGSNASAYVLQFANGRRIYCLSSNPNALAGKRGHVKIDEFALHQDQRALFHVAKPVTQWGGTLSIISTHRGPDTLFNQIIQDIRHKGNPMGWHLFSYPIQKAVEEGIVERINEKSDGNETSDQFLSRIRSECIDEEQWLQEYCCQPADQNSAFFSHEMLNSCTEHNLKLMPLNEFINYAEGGSSSKSFPQSNQANSGRSFYVGVDVGRVKNLFVIDVGERIGDVIWDRVRIELQNRPFSEMQENLYPLLRLPQVKRCCIDAGGPGIQLAEEARYHFGYKVERVTFTARLKEEMAFGMRGDFEDRRLRIVDDETLRSDLRALKKETTSAGNIRLEGNLDDSHCDRTWAKALRQHATKYKIICGGAVA